MSQHWPRYAMLEAKMSTRSHWVCILNMGRCQKYSTVPLYNVSSLCRQKSILHSIDLSTALCKAQRLFYRLTTEKEDQGKNFHLRENRTANIDTALA